MLGLGGNLMAPIEEQIQFQVILFIEDRSMFKDKEGKEKLTYTLLTKMELSKFGDRQIFYYIRERDGINMNQF